MLTRAQMTAKRKKLYPAWPDAKVKKWVDDMMVEDAKDGGADESKEMAHSNVIKGVEIFATGTHNGDQYTQQDLDDMVAAFSSLDFRPAIKVGHTKDSPGSPAYGWVTNLKRVGEKLYADFESMHDSVVEAIRAKAYDRVSSEIYFNLKRGAKTFRRALKAVALLGSEVPAVANLIPLHKMEFAESGFEGVHACEQSLEVPVEALVATLSERVTGLIQLINDKEYDMKTVAQVKAEIKTLSEQLDALKKGKDEDKEAKIATLTTQIAALGVEIAKLDDKGDAEDAETKGKLDKAQADLVASNARIAQLEAKDRASQVKERAATLRVPAFLPAIPRFIPLRWRSRMPRSRSTAKTRMARKSKLTRRSPRSPTSSWRRSTPRPRSCSRRWPPLMTGSARKAKMKRIPPPSSTSASRRT
ncbi:MAG: hypothetical protein U1E51_07885 [Candidatus Binatia bacterium]|nr:hypothetical protein [Candidatus Binatia bacterium]